MFRIHRIIFILLVSVLAGCSSNQNKNAEEIADLDVNVDSNEITLKLSGNTEEDVIFYNLLYPIDMIAVIDKKDSYYNSNLINPLNNISNYTQSNQMALALGVYGADLSYLWIFNQSQQALSYFTGIKQLAGELGIAGDFMTLSAVKAEKYTDNIDTLVNIARKTFYYCDNYLNRNDQSDLAVLILLGGWIESMHAAVELYKSPNNKMACKIISQKYSLTSLLNLLNRQESNQTVLNYTMKLIDILNEFDRLQNEYLSDNLKIDTASKSITFAMSTKTLMQPDDIGELKRMIVELRKDIIQ